jgi:hypothetical protein
MSGMLSIACVGSSETCYVATLHVLCQLATMIPVEHAPLLPSTQAASAVAPHEDTISTAGAHKTLNLPLATRQQQQQLVDICC